MSDDNLRLLIAGGTGLVGGHCIARLRQDERVARIVSLQRRGSSDDARLQVVIADFERLNTLDPELFKADVAICALGTTIKQAGSQAAFRQVDHDHVVAFARLARSGGVERFGIVSAIGADPKSRVFYNCVKGETESSLEALGFASLTIAQPSLLLGERPGFRLAERAFAPIMRWMPRPWRAVSAAAVAGALVEAAVRGTPGTHRIDNASLSRWE
jgi:uncharacterized protein YbjT (DUF2867 family)